jgi:hypothetical protein
MLPSFPPASARAIAPLRAGYSGLLHEALDPKQGPDNKEAFNVGLDLRPDDPELLAAGLSGRSTHDRTCAGAADCFDRDSLLVGEREPEKRLRLRESLVHQVTADAVTHDIEEADVAAGRADLRGDVLERPLVVAER